MGDNKNKITHVGIATENSEFYHCAGDVRKEALTSSSPKFNHDLYNKLHSVMAIDRLIK